MHDMYACVRVCVRARVCMCVAGQWQLLELIHAQANTYMWPERVHIALTLSVRHPCERMTYAYSFICIHYYHHRVAFIDKNPFSSPRSACENICGVE